MPRKLMTIAAITIPPISHTLFDVPTADSNAVVEFTGVCIVGDAGVVFGGGVVVGTAAIVPASDDSTVKNPVAPLISIGYIPAVSFFTVKVADCEAPGLTETSFLASSMPASLRISVTRPALPPVFVTLATIVTESPGLTVVGVIEISDILK